MPLNSFKTQGRQVVELISNSDAICDIYTILLCLSVALDLLKSVYKSTAKRGKKEEDDEGNSHELPEYPRPVGVPNLNDDSDKGK
jgi:hypothetical protein